MKHASTTVVAAALTTSVAFAGFEWPDPMESRWHAQVGMFWEAPRCMLYGTSSHDQPDPLHSSLHWQASEGTVLWLKGRLEENPRVRVEYEGGDGWDVALQPYNPRRDGREVRLAPDVAAGILRNLALERAMTVTLTFDHGATLPYRLVTRGGRLGAPMFQACIQSMIADPPRYWFEPRVRFMAAVDARGRCGIQQMIPLGDAPVFVYLMADGDGGEVLFHRQIDTGGPHGPFRKRKTPDRIEARKLFARDFDLVEEFRYNITGEQLNAMLADLSVGKARDFSLTTPGGARSTLDFGGSLSKPSTAMFLACRKVSR